MADKEQLEILKQGVDVWNKWREDNPGVMPDLSGADLSRLTNITVKGANFDGADLRAVDFNYAYLHSAKFRKAHMTGAKCHNTTFIKANLSDADVRNATLRRANFHEATCYATDFTGSDLSGASLDSADLSGADLKDADLYQASLVETNLTNAVLTNCKIYGISAWNLKLEGAEQSNLVITRHDEPTVTVSNMKVAQFLYLLINNPEIRDVIDTITTKVVLILGRFTDKRLAILEALRTELQKRDYIPVLFDFKPAKSRDIEETVSTLAHMARFIIADITEPKAIPQELSSIVKNLQSVPVLPLLHESQEPWGMFASIKRRSTVVPILEYSSESELLGKIQSKVIEIAEKKVIELAP